MTASNGLNREHAMDTWDDQTKELTEPMSSHNASPVDRRFGQSAPRPVVPKETLLAWVHAVVQWSTPGHTHLRRIPMPPDRVGASDGPDSTVVWHDLR